MVLLQASDRSGDAVEPSPAGAWSPAYRVAREVRGHGEIELPASLEITATYVDAELTMMLTRVSAGEDSRTVRAHANLAFAVLTGPN